MYSYEERLKAVQLYIQYDKSYASVFRELGYPPSSHSIKLWYKEYEETGDLHKSYSSSSKYSDEQRKAAVQYYVEHGRSKSRTVKALGYPTRQQLTEWIKQDLPDEVRPCTKGQSLVHLTKDQKEQVAIELCTRDGSAQEIADKYNVSRYSVYNWAWNLLGKGNVSPMLKKSPIPLLSLKKQWILLNRKSNSSIMKRRTSSARFTVCSWKKMSLRKQPKS